MMIELEMTQNKNNNNEKKKINYDDDDERWKRETIKCRLNLDKWMVIIIFKSFT